MGWIITALSASYESPFAKAARYESTMSLETRGVGVESAISLNLV